MMTFRDLRVTALMASGALAFCGMTIGCAQDDDPMPPKETADPAGVFVDAEERSIFISESHWTIDGARFDVMASNDAQDFVVAANAEENEVDAGRFSRFDWTVDSKGAFRLCVSISDAKTEEDATKFEDADRGEFETGCNGKPWLVLAPPEIVGAYVDAWNTKHDVTAATWSQSVDGSEPATFTFLELSNEAGLLLARNGEKNEFSPGRYSRFEWHESTEGDLYFCQSVFDAESLDAAREASPANREDIEGGCGGFEWSMLTKE